MANNYFNLGLKNTIVFLFLLFCMEFSQNTYALVPSFEEKLILEKNKQNQSAKKAIFNHKKIKSKTKKRKISLRTKLSILKLVLRNKSSKKYSYKAKSKKNIQEWNGQHTAGLLSWASILIAIMAFFTGYFLLGILAVCSAILFFLLIFVEKGNKGTLDDVLWLFAQIINVIVIIGSIFE